MNPDRHIYKPSRWGEIYHNTTCREVLGAGAAGPGKTTILIHDPLAQIQVEHARCEDTEHPHYHPWGTSTGWALHLRRTTKMLEQSIQITMREFPQIDPGARWQEQKLTWTFSSGYKYQFGHCSESYDWQNFMSFELSHLAFDELTQFEKEQYDQISGRVRSTDPVLSLMLKVRAMSNPVMSRGSGDSFSVKDPHWVRRYFVDPAPEGNTIIETPLKTSTGETVHVERLYLPATLYDNPNAEFVRQYEITLLSKPAHIRQALLYGDWYVVAGGYFAEAWNKQLHVTHAFHVPDDWPQFRSMDWGFKAPGCVHWYAMDEDGNLFVTRELTFQGKSDREVALLIREIEEDMGLWEGDKSLITGAADTQLWEMRGDTGMSKAATMMKMGVPWVPADKTRRHRNAERILMRLNDHDHGTKTPGLVFFEHCKQIIKTLPSTETAENNEEPAESDQDHWLDSVGYGVAFASKGRRGIPPLRRKSMYDYDAIRKTETTSHGKLGYGEAL